MEELRTDFRIRLKDKMGYPDYDILLHVSDPMTASEIESGIMYWAEVNSHNIDGYSPVDIMDDLCDNHEGWWWEDGDREDIYIEEW